MSVVVPPSSTLYGPPAETVGGWSTESAHRETIGSWSEVPRLSPGTSSGKSELMCASFTACMPLKNESVTNWWSRSCAWPSNVYE